MTFDATKPVPPTPRVGEAESDGARADGFAALRSANVARNVEWSAGNDLSLSFRGNELAGEVGEACNVLKKIDRERMGLVGSRATVGAAAEELADVIICADLAAMDLGIDLGAAVEAKFNATSEKRGLKTRLALRATTPHPKPGAGDEFANRVLMLAKQGGTVFFNPDEMRRIASFTREALARRGASAPVAGGEAVETQSGERDPEGLAWDWMDDRYGNVELGHDPNDRDYDADDMVDAFMAGRAARPRDERGANEEVRQEIKRFEKAWEDAGHDSRNSFDARGKALNMAEACRSILETSYLRVRTSTPAGSVKEG